MYEGSSKGILRHLWAARCKNPHPVEWTEFEVFERWAFENNWIPGETRIALIREKGIDPTKVESYAVRPKGWRTPRPKLGVYRDHAPLFDYETKEMRRKLLSIWRNLLQRIDNPKCRSYRWYGAKGVGVCEEWRNPDVFRRWAIESGYEIGLSIERMKGELDYFPENCEWIPMSEQRRRQHGHKPRKYLSLRFLDTKT